MSSIAASFVFDISRLKVSTGYKDIYEEFEASLRRAFTPTEENDYRGADFIALYSRRQGEFLFASAAYGVEKGWLKEQECRGIDPDQDYELRYRLTDEGRNHFGVT